MKPITRYLFSSGEYPQRVNIAMIILRVFIGLFMLSHGWGKLEMLLSGEAIQFPDPLGIGSTGSLAMAVFAEVFCAILVIIGLVTRLAIVPLLITMFVAAFIIHAEDGFGKQEFALLYALVFLAIGIIGAGKYSLDSQIIKQRSSNRDEMR